MKFRLSHQSYRKKPYVVRWSENGKTHNRFFATEADWTHFIENFNQQDVTVPLIEPHKLYRWQEASRLAPEADPVEVYRFWLQNQPKASKTVYLADAAHAYLCMMAEVGRDKNYTGHARKALEDFEHDAGNKPIHDFDTECLREHLFELPYAAVTIRHRRSHLLCAFAWWVEQGWISENPVQKVKRPQVVTDEPGILSVEEMEKLFRANEKVDPDICGLLALGAFAGMRASAIAKVDHEEIDFRQRDILTPASKTKKKRRQWIEGLPENLWEWLKRTPPEAFAMTQRQMLHRRAEAFKRAGLLIEPDDIAYENRKREKKGEPMVNWKVKHPPKNCLRHSLLFCASLVDVSSLCSSVVSYHVALHRDPGKTALIVSHRSQEILWQIGRMLNSILGLDLKPLLRPSLR